MFFVPGRDIFLRRSELSAGANGALALLTIVITSAIAIAFFNAVDGSFIGSTLVSQAMVTWGGLALVSQAILQRDAFKTRWRERAFSMAFRWLVIPGLTLIMVGIAHFVWIEGERVVPRQVAWGASVYLIGTGVLVWYRAITTFGIDNLSLMYIYFPEESRLVNSNVYSILRHPFYSCVLRMVFALALVDGSACALFAAVMAIASMWAWVHWVEERELIGRFGEGYEGYRARVPAFFNLNPRIWITLWRFLLMGQ